MVHIWIELLVLLVATAAVVVVGVARLEKDSNWLDINSSKTWKDLSYGAAGALALVTIVLLGIAKSNGMSNKALVILAIMMLVGAGLLVASEIARTKQYDFIFNSNVAWKIITWAGAGVLAVTGVAAIVKS